MEWTSFNLEGGGYDIVKGFSLDFIVLCIVM